MSDTDHSGRLTPLHERRLITDAQGGCQSSARELIAAHQDRLYAFIWRMIRNDHDAEEICQDAFLRAFQALDKFNFAYRFSTWLFTIGYRLCLNTMRRRKDYTGDVDFQTLRTDGRAEEADETAEAVANSDEARRLKKVIWDSVDQLTPPQRASVLLFYRESLGCQEIGDILEMPAATVKSHLHRARNRLKGLLESEMVEDWSQVRFSEAGGTG
ncbi:MAG: RNA polymerase sigma factor [Phycisphaerae bacterium]